MPSIGEENKSGEISTWHRKVGDKLKIDDPLCDIDMDGLTIELEADEDGYLSEISVPDGIKVKSGTTIARQVQTEKELKEFINIRKNSRETAESDLIFAYRILADLNFDEYLSLNHLSVSIPSASIPFEKIMITGKDGFCWHNITKKDLKEVNIQQILKQNKLINDINNLDIYCSLIRNNSTINTIFHINTQNLLTFSSISENNLLMLNPESCRFFDRIIYVDLLEEIYNNNFITFANVICIKNNGVIITGNSIEQAFDTFFYFDKMVELHLKLLLLQNNGIKINEINNDDAQEIYRKYQENSYKLAKQHFDARKRSVLEKEVNLMEETQQ